MEDKCNILEESWNALNSDDSSPTKNCALLCIGVIASTFLLSTATGNYSQVDKLWSIVPFCYCWLVVCDERTLLMAVVATIWGLRLTWNFNRRGGYKWPPWDGDEDYRWKYIQDGHFLKILQNKLAWIIFNFAFISLYQNILLLLIATPSIVAHIVVTSCGKDSPLNMYDYVAATLFLVFVVIESIADNQQYRFQTEKYRRRDAGEPLTGEFADGFQRSGLFAIVRKPNYSAEQAIWITFYLFSVGAVKGEKFINWSIIGSILLCALFQGSGWFTEKITVGKYPKYTEYMKAVPLYIPKLQLRFGKEEEKKD